MGTTDPYFEFYRKRNHIWEAVARTEVVIDAANPSCYNVALHAHTLCQGDFDRKLLTDLQQMHARTRDGTKAPTTLVDPSTLLHEMRLKKSPDELAIMRRAAAITHDAHLAAMKAVREGVGEWEIEAIVDGTFRSQGGWGPGYTTIAAGGANACVLHYTTNHERLKADDCMLLDAGCELDGYTADVTRTFPASGKFTPAQREIYEVVLKAQLAGCDHARPGNTFVSVHDVTTRALARDS